MTALGYAIYPEMKRKQVSARLFVARNNKMVKSYQFSNANRCFYMVNKLSPSYSLKQRNGVRGCLIHSSTVFATHDDEISINYWPLLCQLHKLCIHYALSTVRSVYWLLKKISSSYLRIINKYYFPNCNQFLASFWFRRSRKLISTITTYNKRARA